MAIVFDKETDCSPCAQRTGMYQMKADDKGILLHTYYGRKTDICDYSYLIQRRDHGFSWNPGRGSRGQDILHRYSAAGIFFFWKRRLS